jgi:flagellar basal-body rod protein FlgF
MIRGMISGITAMRAQVLNQEIIANNLSNVDTLAYKRDKPIFQTFSDVLMYRLESLGSWPIGGYTAGTLTHKINTIHELGPVEVTDNPLHILLPENCYLAVETPAGFRYTRRGDLSVKDGMLTVCGYNVVGRSGSIAVEDTDSCFISRDGGVIVAGQEIDTLAIYMTGDNTELRKTGNSLFQSLTGDLHPVEEVEITTGALEKSSVDPVTEMVNMIFALRLYEAANKAIRSHDETLDQAVNRVGKPI